MTAGAPIQRATDGEAALEPPPPSGPPLPLELRFRRGRRRGEALVLHAGELKLGTARTNEVQVREAGVSFRHAVFHIGASGDVVVEDLASRGGTFVNDQPVQGRRPLAPGDRVRFGEEVELELARVAAREPREALAVLVPYELAHELVEVDDLRLAAGMSDPLRDALAAAPDEAARAALAADAERFARDVRTLIRADLVPSTLEDWVRWSAPDPLGCLAAPGDCYILIRRWELLAWLPDVARGDAAARVSASMAWLLQGAERLTPRNVIELGDGWLCEFEAERPMLGRFSRLRAVGDGRSLALSGTPAVVSPRAFARSAEDPVEEGIAAVRAANHWRPPARGVGPAAPQLPPGGRQGRRRPLPERPK